MPRTVWWALLLTACAPERAVSDRAIDGAPSARLGATDAWQRVTGS